MNDLSSSRSLADAHRHPSIVLVLLILCLITTAGVTHAQTGGAFVYDPDNGSIHAISEDESLWAMVVCSHPEQSGPTLIARIELGQSAPRLQFDDGVPATVTFRHTTSDDAEGQSTQWEWFGWSLTRSAMDDAQGEVIASYFRSDQPATVSIRSAEGSLLHEATFEFAGYAEQIERLSADC